MIQWYNIYNKTDFEDANLVSRELTKTLGELGEKTILLTKGNGIGITIDGVFLVLELNDKNPFKSGDWLAYVDEDDEIWLGYVEEPEDED